MDAYSSYIMRLSQDRVGELRRESAEYAMSRAARHRRTSLWARVRGRLVFQRRPDVEPAASVPLPTRVGEVELRRSA